MRIPRSYIEAYSRALNGVSEQGKVALANALEQVDYSRPVAEVRAEVVGIMQQACGASSTVSARLAADFYDGLRARFGIDDSFTAEVDPVREYEATEGAVRAFADDLRGTPDVESFKRKCTDRLDYETRRAANECMARNAKRDPRKPKWARVPVGACTCDWCIMLASRGFVYHSEDTASHAHPNCDCRIVPSWDRKGASVEGYDVEYYKDCYEHPENHPEIQEAINARRRELRSEQNEDNKQSDAEKDSALKQRQAIYNEYEAAVKRASELRRQLLKTKDESRKMEIRALIAAAEEDAKKIRVKLATGEFLIEQTRALGIEYIEPKKWAKPPSTDEIIGLIGGGDKTDGSCSSLAFAYFGNKGGDIVRDFRGGTSCDYFAKYARIKAIANMDEVEAVIISGNNGFQTAEKALESAEKGKRYYFSAGEHSAVVERRGADIYYLELQSEDNNGWHKLTKGGLKKRFGCKKSRTSYGAIMSQEAILIDGDSLSGSTEFRELMGFVNTQEDSQQKGEGGYAK